jgi:hypothetical protein
MCEMYGYSREEILNHDVGILSSGKPPYTLEISHEWAKKTAAGRPRSLNGITSIRTATFSGAK